MHGLRAGPGLEDKVTAQDPRGLAWGPESQRPEDWFGKGPVMQTGLTRMRG